MNILFLSGQYPPNTKGGGEISTHLIARGLAQRGHQVTVVTEGAEKDEELDGVSVRRLPLRLLAKPLLERRHSRSIAAALERNIDLAQYDVIHAHDFRSALALYELIPTRRVGIASRKAVVTIRDYAAISGDTNNILSDGTIPDDPVTASVQLRSQRIAEAPLWRKPFRAWQYLYNIGYRRRAFTGIPNHIYISRAQREIIQRALHSSARSTVIYNPVDPDYLSSPVRPGTAGEVLYVGRVEMYKGVGLLLEVWPKIVKKYPKACLQIAGEGAQLADYKKIVQAQKLDHSVTFTGYVRPELLVGYYNHAQIVAAPHLWIEPFGRTVAEAMARSKVVVASKRGGPGEMITHNETGLLFDPEKAGDLESQLVKALAISEDERRKIGIQARQWVHDDLSMEKIAQQYEYFYEKKRESL